MALITRESINRYILNNLGYPVVAVELSPEQLSQAIDIAINEYLATGAFETAYKMLPTNGTSNSFDIPEDVATIRNVVFNIPFETAAASTEDIFSFAVYSSPYGPNYTNFIHAPGNLGVFFEYLQNRQRVIGNDVTFKVVDNKLHVWPYPKHASFILIEYSKNAYGIEDKDSQAISTSNSWGIDWIRSMSLAVAKGMLGRIRSKFSSVAGGPGTESQTLDGKDLLTESKEEIKELRERLLQHPSHDQFIIG